MKAPYYDKATNSVFLRGALNPINPQTGEAWHSEQEAVVFIAALSAQDRAGVVVGDNDGDTLARPSLVVRLKSTMASLVRR